MKEIAQENRAFGDEVEDYVEDIWRETALLETVSENLARPLASRTMMVFRCADIYFGKTVIPEILGEYRKLFGQELGLKAADYGSDEIETDYFEKFLTLEGVFSFEMAKAESGNHVFVSRRGEFTPVEIEAFALDETENIADFPKIYAQNRRHQRAGDFNVVRLYNERLLALDFRSRLATHENLTFRELRSFVLSGLKAPPELKL